jgi:hypothetical protein
MDIGWAVIIAAFIGALIGIGGYLINSCLESRRTKCDHKEERYVGMIKASRGFYESQDKELQQQFIDEYNLAWLYAPDSIVRLANEFFNTVKVKPIPSSDEEKKEALRTLIWSMRKDLFPRTSIKLSEFETWKPT